ncbi:MAG: hypothetical protein AAF727_01790 [Pseudomonadota bacterium]
MTAGLWLFGSPATAQQDTTIEAMNTALRIAKELCITKGTIDELVVVAEASGGFALRKIGAQGDVQVVHRTTTLEGLTNGIDEELVDAQLANTESARACNQENYYRILDTLLPEKSGNAAPEMTTSVARVALRHPSDYRWASFKTAVAGNFGEFFVLASFVAPGSAKFRDIVFRVALNEDGAQGLTPAVFAQSSDVIHDVSWDARHGAMVLIAPSDQKQRQGHIFTVRSGAFERAWTGRFPDRLRNLRLGAAQGRHAVASHGMYFLLDRKFDQISKPGTRMGNVRDIEAFANGRLILAGDRFDRDEGAFYPFVDIRDADAGFAAPRLDPADVTAFGSAKRQGRFEHVVLSPDRQKALVLGTTTDVEYSFRSKQLIMAVFDVDGQLLFERSVPVRTVPGASTLSTQAQAVWRDARTVWVQYMSRDGARRLVIDPTTGRSRSVPVDDTLPVLAPTAGCAPLGSAQYDVRHMLLLELCDGDEPRLFARAVVLSEPS